MVGYHTVYDTSNLKARGREDVCCIGVLCGRLDPWSVSGNSGECCGHTSPSGLALCHSTTNLCLLLLHRYSALLCHNLVLRRINLDSFSLDTQFAHTGSEYQSISHWMAHFQPPN